MLGPDGIGKVKFGMSVAAAKATGRLTGPRATGFEGCDEDGRMWAPVAGNSKAVYNISISEGKVIQLNLQLEDQGCYE